MPSTRSPARSGSRRGPSSAPRSRAGRTRSRTRPRGCYGPPLLPRGPPLTEFRIVVVCTGNRFRSPLAAALLRDELRDLPVDIESLGTLDVGPLPPLPEALSFAHRHGLDLGTHSARPLHWSSIDAADLMLGFEAAHVEKAVQFGVPRDRAFTLPELVRLLERVDPSPDGAPVERARRALQLAHALRERPGAGPAPEITDPLGGPPAAFADAGTSVERLTRELARRLFPAVAGARAGPDRGPPARVRRSS